MVFPVESEDKATRSLLMLCQDHARLVVETFRKTLAIVDCLIKGELEPMSSRMAEIDKLRMESQNVKRAFIRELHGSGGILMTREDFYRLMSKSWGLIDYIEQISFHLLGIGERRWRITKDVGEGMTKVFEASFETLIKLRESLISLGFNSERTIILTRDVDEWERRVDAYYRELDFTIATSKMELPLILILRDVNKSLEDMIDSAEEEADLIRILSL